MRSTRKEKASVPTNSSATATSKKGRRRRLLLRLLLLLLLRLPQIAHHRHHRDRSHIHCWHLHHSCHHCSELTSCYEGTERKNIVHLNYIGTTTGINSFCPWLAVKLSGKVGHAISGQHLQWQLPNCHQHRRAAHICRELQPSQACHCLLVDSRE